MAFFVFLGGHMALYLLYTKSLIGHCYYPSEDVSYFFVVNKKLMPIYIFLIIK